MNISNQLQSSNLKANRNQLPFKAKLEVSKPAKEALDVGIKEFFQACAPNIRERYGARGFEFANIFGELEKDIEKTTNAHKGKINILKGKHQKFILTYTDNKGKIYSKDSSGNDKKLNLYEFLPNAEKDEGKPGSRSVKAIVSKLSDLLAPKKGGNDPSGGSADSFFDKVARTIILNA